MFYQSKENTEMNEITYKYYVSLINKITELSDLEFIRLLNESSFLLNQQYHSEVSVEYHQAAKSMK